MEEFSMPQSILQIVSEKGFDGLREIMQMLFNEAMKMERENDLHASPYQRTDLRTDHTNGFKPRTINTLQGEIQLSIPQTRNGGFYPSCLEKGMRSERAINVAMAEMYIHGVATREVTAILEKMCGLEVSAMQVSRATEMLDAEFKKWREQPLPEPIKYLLLDARYEKVRREDNAVADCALLIAYGITESGRRCVLGVRVELSEAEVHWRKFLESLIAGPSWTETDRQRQSCWFESCSNARISVCAVAAMPVSSSAECHCAYPQEKYAAGGTQRHS